MYCVNKVTGYKYGEKVRFYFEEREAACEKARLLSRSGAVKVGVVGKKGDWFSVDTIFLLEEEWKVFSV